MQRDGADDDDHEHAECVGPQDTPRARDWTVSDHPDGGEDPEDEHGPVGRHGDPGARTPPPSRGDDRAAEEREDEDRCEHHQS